VVPVPEPDLESSPAAITVGARSFEVLLSWRAPRLVVFRKFLSDEECDAMVEAALPRLEISTVVDNDSGANALHTGRVSDGMFFGRCESPLIRAIEERIASLVRWPLDHGETIQVLRYGLGGKYDPHFDYFDPALPGSAEPLRIAGNRVGTLIMVLKAPTKGGSTIFPDVGVEIFAQKGNAVFFSYDCPDAATKTLHGGAPVLEGEKWIATKWFRERTFNT
jgi:prolyl 4-hydroxylase